MQKKSVCQICHENLTGCCLMKPDWEPYMFGLTLMEVKRIIMHCNLLPGESFIVDRVHNDFVFMCRDINSQFKQLFINNFRIRLRTKDGKCVFLGDEGCVLPVDIRPFYCRIYPFWFTDKEELIVLQSPDCLCQQDSDTLEGMLTQMGENEDNLKMLYYQWKEAVNKHFNYFMKCKSCFKEALDNYENMALKEKF